MGAVETGKNNQLPVSRGVAWCTSWGWQMKATDRCRRGQAVGEMTNGHLGVKSPLQAPQPAGEGHGKPKASTDTGLVMTWQAQDGLEPQEGSESGCGYVGLDLAGKVAATPRC